MKVDLGCGTNKQKGFIGVDRFALPEVDIVADADEGLPFEDNTVELLFASHSLEHVKNLTKVMKEIYRVCKHGAQVCIVSPYSEQKLNIANPYHLFQFNEHTPRFWTNHSITTIPEEQWSHPHALQWGLGESDHHDLNMDMRCVKMEFFYFPEYISKSDEEKIRARKSRIDVCDQIMYHLIVIKEEVNTEQFNSLVSDIEWYNSPFVIMRRYNDESKLHCIEQTALEQELIAARDEIQMLETQIVEKNLVLDMCSQEVETLTNEKLQLKKQVYSNQMRYDHAIETNSELNEIRNRLISKNQELEREGILVANQMENNLESRYWKVKRVFERRVDLWPQVGANFLEFKDQALIYGFKSKGNYLNVGGDIRDHEYVSYELGNITPGDLVGIGLALSYPITPLEGMIGIELIENNNKILVTSSIEAGNLIKYTPVIFSFNKVSINSLDNSYALRIFARNLKVPVRLYSFQKKFNKRKEIPFIYYQWEDHK